MNAIDWTPMFAETPVRFFLESEDVRFVFVLDEAGRVLRLDVHDEGQVFQLDRVAD